MKKHLLQQSLSLLTSSLFIILLTFNSANAASIKWVDQSGGNDTNDGNTEVTAYKTLQFAIDNSDDGEDGNPSVINVMNGTYGEVSAEQDPCFDFAMASIIIQQIDYLTIQAVPEHNPKIMPGVGDIVSLAIDDSDHIIIDNIDSDQATARFDHWHVCNSEDLTVRNSTFEGEHAKDGIDFHSSHENAVIEHNVFRDMSEDTLQFSKGAYSGVYIQDNIFEPNQRRPILIRTTSQDVITGFTIQRNLFLGTDDEEAIRLIGADDITVVNNVIMNSTQQGLYIDSNSSNIDVLHNTFFNNDQECFLAEVGCNGEIRIKVTSADIIIQNNIFYANGFNDIFETTATSIPGENFNLIFNSPQIDDSFTFGADTIAGDPLFVSIAAGFENLNLTIASPAIDSATDQDVTEDITEKTRPLGALPDIGAYEFGLIGTKMGVREDLVDLLPTNNSKNDKRIIKAIKSIDKSLNLKYWEDASHLTSKGKKVFYNEQKSVRELMKIDDGPIEIETAILALVAVDAELAQILLDEAIANDGHSHDIEKAEKEITKALDDVAKGKFDKAINHYKKAWQNAYKALYK